jgi:hypothetical protein
MRSFVRAVAVLSALALVAPAAVAHAQGKPVVAVLYFDNNSIGKDARDFDGVGKGIADLLTNDMLNNTNVRVVERERVQALVVEHGLTKGGSIDPTTAVRLGKIIGAQYMIYGGFLSDGKGTYVITSKAVNVETSAISNGIKITSKGEDVLGLINDLSTKLNAEMKLPALRVGDAGAPKTAPGKEVSEAAKSGTTPANTVAKTTPKPSATVAQSKKMDIRTAMLYSKALEEEDAGNKTKAVELYKQVVSKFPDFAPAQKKITNLGG